jgi:hypothetical protein
MAVWTRKAALPESTST